ncbi:MAG: hypothetical protein QOC76_1867, partial [Mycobacterium sp.]|nr:hypothetical protein [Mycobacterium sp.]
CRAGGEEFLVSIVTRHGGSEALAEQFCAAIAELPDGVTASIGTHATPLERLRGRDPDSFIEELVAAADAAMYVAKRNGGNQVHAG